LKKILLITDTLCDINGVSRFIQDCVKHSKNEDIAFKAICSTLKQECEEDENILILKPFFRMKMFYYPQLDLVIPNIFSLYKLVKSENPNLVHIPTAGPVGVIAVFICKILKLPIVGVYHTDYSSYVYKNTNSKIIKKLTSSFLHWFYKNHIHLFSRTKIYVQKIQEELDKPKENIHLIKAGIDTDIFSSSYNNRTIWSTMGLNQEHFIALYVGRVTTEKNISFLYKVWSEFIHINPNASLVIVGYGYQKEDVKQYEEYNIYHIGIKRGEELSQIYASSDIFLFPSVTDTLGQVVMESIASGVPVIVSDVGGPQEIVKNTKKACGFVQTTQSTSEWIHTLTELSRKDASYFQLKQNCQESRDALSIKTSVRDFFAMNKQIMESL